MPLAGATASQQLPADYPRPPGRCHYFTVRYEEWEGVHPEGQPGLIFIPDDEKKERQLAIHFPDGAERVWWVEARSWEEACAAQHEHHGWEPYVPMDPPAEPPSGR